MHALFWVQTLWIMNKWDVLYKIMLISQNLTNITPCMVDMRWNSSSNFMNYACKLMMISNSTFLTYFSCYSLTSLEFPHLMSEKHSLWVRFLPKLLNWTLCSKFLEFPSQFLNLSLQSPFFTLNWTLSLTLPSSIRFELKMVMRLCSRSYIGLI